MRKLLVILAVAVLALTAGLWQQPQDASAASLAVVTYMYHPTGASTAYLSCGWHWDCNTSGGLDSNPLGLDWRPCGLTPTNQKCTYDNTTWVRFKSYTGSGSGWVAQAQSFNWERNGCPGIDSRVYRWSNKTRLIGVARNNHSTHTGSTSYLNLYGTTTGSTASGVVGSFLDPGPDPCSSYWHTMQWYISGSYDNSWYKNSTGFPDETACRIYNCAQPKGVWTTEEYGFSFNS